MSIIAQDSGGAPRQLIPTGIQKARCILVADLGTHHTEFNGEDTGLKRKVVIGWELPAFRIKSKEGEEMPMMLSKTYTLSLHENATLRIHLKAWRGQDFSFEELKAFDVAKLAGAPCLLSVEHGTKKASGEAFAKVGMPGKWSKDLVGVPPPQEHPSLVYEIGMAYGGPYHQLPEWIQKEIADSTEFAFLAATGEPYGNEAPAPEQEAAPVDDLPF
jgi:hypothetical protein